MEVDRLPTQDAHPVVRGSPVDLGRSHQTGAAVAMAFDPHSTDSMFATVLARLGQQDKMAEEFRAQAKLVAAETLAAVHAVGGRVSSLENDRWFNRGVAAALGAGASAVVAWWKNKNG